MVKLRFLTKYSSCICGAEFCYLCGARWETCACRQLDEQNPLDQVWEFDEHDEVGLMAFAVRNVRRIDPDGRIEWLPEAFQNGH